MTNKFYSAVTPPLGMALVQQITQGTKYNIAHMEIGTIRSANMQNTHNYSGLWPHNNIRSFGTDNS